MSFFRVARPSTSRLSLSSPSEKSWSRAANVCSTVFKLVISSPISSPRPASVEVSIDVWARTEAIVPPCPWKMRSSCPDRALT